MGSIKNKVASIVKYKGDKKGIMMWIRRLPQRPPDEEILKVFALQTQRFVLWSIETGLIIW